MKAGMPKSGRICWNLGAGAQFVVTRFVGNRQKPFEVLNYLRSGIAHAT